MPQTDTKQDWQEWFERIITLRFSVRIVLFLSLLAFATTVQASQPGREVVTIILKAGPRGELSAFQADANPLTSGKDLLQKLHELMQRKARQASDAGQEDPEVVLRVDDQLRFDEVAKVIRAVSRTGDGPDTTWLSTSVRLQTQNYADFRLGHGYQKYLFMRGYDRLKIGVDTDVEKYQSPPPLSTVR